MPSATPPGPPGWAKMILLWSTTLAATPRGSTYREGMRNSYGAGLLQEQVAPAFFPVSYRSPNNLMRCTYASSAFSSVLAIQRLGCFRSFGSFVLSSPYASSADFNRLFEALGDER
jgi:hypothetical protein